MITIINPTRLTRQPFFKDLINYLDQHDDVILRQIKAQFPDQPVDKLIEEYIKAGFHPSREINATPSTCPSWESADLVDLDQRGLYPRGQCNLSRIKSQVFQTELLNTTNAAILIEETDFERNAQTLSNYFYKVKHQYPLTERNKKSSMLFWEMSIPSIS